MKKILSAILCFVMIFSFAACGGSKDALEGTWTQQHDDYGTVAWEFDGSGKCTLDTDFLDKAPGTYTINDESKVTIKLDVWDDEKVYEYTVSYGNLKLTATDELSPSYEELTKK